MATEEGRLSLRVRTAETGDDAALRAAIGTTLAHPDDGGKRESYRGAAAKGELLVLERYDRQEHTWNVAGFVEHHLRVDDTLTIRDLGTAGDEPQVGVVRYLLDEVFSSYKPVAATVKIRRDATAWLDIFRDIPGFFMEGEEYRRPHYWTVWRWEAQHARAARQPAPRQQNQRAAGPGGPRPAPGPDGGRWRGGVQGPGSAPGRGEGPPSGGPGTRFGGPRPEGGGRDGDARPPRRGPGGPGTGPGGRFGGPRPGPGSGPRAGGSGPGGRSSGNRPNQGPGRPRGQDGQGGPRRLD